MIIQVIQISYKGRQIEIPSSYKSLQLLNLLFVGFGYPRKPKLIGWAKSQESDIN